MTSGDKIPIVVYTDGSCHTQLRIGGWAAIVFVNGDKTTLSGLAMDTTHNRMELTAVIEAIRHLKKYVTGPAIIHIYTDSQYVVGLEGRRERLTDKSFVTKKGNDIHNADLMQELWEACDGTAIQFEKVKAHVKATSAANHNIEADKLSRNIVREAVRLHTSQQAN